MLCTHTNKGSHRCAHNLLASKKHFCRMFLHVHTHTYSTHTSTTHTKSFPETFSQKNDFVLVHVFSWTYRSLMISQHLDLDFCICKNSNQVFNIFSLSSVTSDLSKAFYLMVSIEVEIYYSIILMLVYHRADNRQPFQKLHQPHVSLCYV